MEWLRQQQQTHPSIRSHLRSRRPILANGTAQWTIYDGAAPLPLAPLSLSLSAEKTRLEDNAIPFVGGYFRTQCVRALWATTINFDDQYKSFQKLKKISKLVLYRARQKSRSQVDRFSALTYRECRETG